MDKEQRLAERVKNCRSKRLSQETASKLADKTGSNAKEEDLDGRDEALKRSEGSRGRRAQNEAP